MELKLDSLKQMKCPKCGSKVDDVSIGYRCTNRTEGIIEDSCDFFISYERFQRFVKGMLEPKNVYEAEKVDRSGWGGSPRDLPKACLWGW